MAHSKHLDHHEPADGAVHAHISSASFYWTILGVLLVFTAITYGISFVSLGPLNLLVAVLIATAKATLVVLFFMHLRWDQKFNALFFVGSLLFGGIFLVYTINDTSHRAQVDAEAGARYSKRKGEWAAGLAATRGEPVRPLGSHDEESQDAEGSPAPEESPSN